MDNSMRHAGMHWPANAGGEHPNRDTIYRLPGVADGALLMGADSARFWYDEAWGECPLIVWRGLPRPDRLPAKLGWDTKKVADECVNLWSEQPHHGREWFVPLNELQFPKESGENWRGYGYMVARLAPLRVQLESYFASLGQDVGLMFPAWVPSDDGAYLDEWRGEASQWDAICLHAYGDAETMRSRYLSYRTAFPSTPIFVGEWNSNHEGHDERAALEMWADVAATDPDFMGAAYFIWETRNAGEGDLSVWGNDDRLRLFQNPPAAVAPVEPPPPPVEEPPMPPALPQGIDVSNNNGHVDWPAVAAGGAQFAVAKITEGTYFRDGFFAENWAGMKANGLVRGAYHFAIPSQSGPVAEADYFVDAFGLLGASIEPGDFLALDLEDPDAQGDLSGWTLTWLQRVEQRVGFKPMCYTSPGYVQEHSLANRPEIGQYGLWLASWRSTLPGPVAPWDVVALWQDGVYPSFPGISGDCDHDFYNGPIETLKLYGKPAAEPQPEPAPSPYTVGPGILSKMAETGDSPATDEEYHGEVYSEAFGVSGARYTYLASLGRTFRYEPAA